MLISEWSQKRTALERRETIELVPSEENDYGIGSGTVTHFLAASASA